MKNKQGFTLIELIIVIGLLSIIGVGLAVYLNTTILTYNDAQKYSDLQNRCDVMADRLSEKFRYYEGVLQLSNDKASINLNETIITTSNGPKRMIVEQRFEQNKPKNLYEDMLDGYEHNEILFAYDPGNNNLIITLKLAEDSEDTPFDYRLTIHLLNKPDVSCQDMEVCSVDTNYTILTYK